MLMATGISMAAVAVTAAVAVGGAGAAFAWFTATGEGTGTATVGTSTPWVVNILPPTDSYYPGGAPVDVVASVYNDGEGVQRFDSARLTLESITKAPGAPGGPCEIAWFTIPSTLTELDRTVSPDSASEVIFTTTMRDAPINQDGCKNATLNFKVVIDPAP